MNTPYHSKALPGGTVLREWRLEDVLGVGGFGIVYRGKGVYFDELVAIKEYFPSAISDRHDGTTVAPTDSSSEEVYELGLHKFIEEAKILWSLSKPERHPNIVSVRSLFEIHGTAYMVMDFESGVSLSKMLRDGHQFDEESLLALIRPIAEGLDRVHRAGVIHRDIKPANILVDDTGRPVLIDFGSARFESGQATSTKVTFYTPPYAAIEQYVKTYPQGPWTDIYALGVALYQCVTGEKPPEVLERLHGGLGEALSSRERPGFSRAFTRAVDAAMAIRPAERPQSMSEWLKLFDLDDAALDEADARRDDADDATRIGDATTFASWAPAVATESSPTPADLPAHPALVETPVSDDVAPEASAGLRRRWIAAIAAVVVVVLGGGVAALLLHPGQPTPAKPAAVAAPASTAAAPAASSAAPSQTVVVPPVDQDAQGLVADARRLGRPSREVATLTGFASKISALSAQIQGLASAPGGAAKAPPLVAELDRLATSMAHGEAATLDRAAQGPAREVQRMLGNGSGGASADAAAAVRQAKASLANAVAATSHAADATGSIDAARRSLVAYGAFTSAYASATRYFGVAKHSEFMEIAAQARSMAGQVTALAAGPRPGLFAPQSRKTAYQALQENATRAKAEAAQIDQLSQGLSETTDVDRLNSAIAQASAIKQALAGLYASSSAAAQPPSASPKN